VLNRGLKNEEESSMVCYGVQRNYIWHRRCPGNYGGAGEPLVEECMLLSWHIFAATV